MSQSNTDLAELANKNGGTLFEDALKKFTSNLTDLEHRKNEENNKSDQSDHDDINDSLENITTDIQSTRPMENIMSSQPEANDNTEEVPEEKSLTFIAEDRESHQKLRPQKTSPFLNDRNRIRLPIRTEEKSFDTQAIVGRQTNKGWVPLTNKPRPKHKPKKPVERNEIHLPSDPAPNSGHYMFPSNDNRPYGMPQTYHSMNDMSSHMFESRPFPHSYIPFDHRHQIRHRQPFHKYSYYTESELSPTLMSLDMRGDANKPSHIAPAKEAADAAAAAVDKVLGQKEQVVGKHFDDKTQLIDEKQMIIEEKPGMAGMGGMGGIEGMAGLTGGGMGEEVLGQHMTCCDLLNNNGGPQVIHEEVIKTDFDDDKFKPEVHFGSHFGNQIPHSYLHKDCKYPFRQSYPHQFYWPQHHSYRRPIYRPKLFYKPLFFG